MLVGLVPKLPRESGGGVCVCVWGGGGGGQTPSTRLHLLPSAQILCVCVCVCVWGGVMASVGRSPAHTPGESGGMGL